MNSESIKGYNELMILCLLLGKDSYGYELSRQIRERTDHRYVIKETTLYSAFDRLERMGCIESYSGTETFGKPRTYYRLTEKGKDYYQSKCAEWKDMVGIVGCFVKEEL